MTDRRRPRRPRDARDPEAERQRRMRTVLETELRDPLAGINRTLARMALATPSASGDTGSAHLLRRARRLAAELTEVVDDLLGTRDGPRAREPQQTLFVAAAIDDALAETHPLPAVTVDCPEHLAATVHPGRFHDMLVSLLSERARGTETVTLLARHRGGELHLDATGLPAPTASAGRSLDRLQACADSLGGRLEIVGRRPSATLRIRIPQQRSADVSNVSSRREGTARSR